MLSLTTTQKATLALEPKDKDGNIAPVDGVPEWAISDPAVATITPSTDGMTAVVTSAGAGSTVVTATVDADLGPGRRELSATLDVEVTAVQLEAETLEIIAGAPEEQ